MNLYSVTNIKTPTTIYTFIILSRSDKERGLRCRMIEVKTGFILLICSSLVCMTKQWLWKFYGDRQDK